MTGIAIRKYQPLSNWDSWDQQSLNVDENGLSPIDLRDKSSERALARENTRSPKAPVRLSVVWSEDEGSDISGDGGEAGKAQLCWGSHCFGLFGSRRKSSQYVEVSFREQRAGNREYGRRQDVKEGYRKPAAWKRMVRKLRAEAKQVHTACCEGLCFPREDSDYDAFIYEKNFDSGRWQQPGSVHVSNQSPLLRSESQRTWKNTSGIREFSLQGSSLGQRRNRDPDSTVQAKKVTFASA